MRAEGLRLFTNGQLFQSDAHVTFRSARHEVMPVSPNRQSTRTSLTESMASV